MSSVIQYYPLDVGTNSGTNIANFTTGSNVFDASLNGGSYISTTNYLIGTGALTMDISGQFVRLNNSLTTGNGLSFAFWMRGNNGVGQYTLLDYSNGSGGKNRISLGLQNNTLLGQVVNGMGTVSFTALTNSSATSVTGIAYSSSVNRLVWMNYTTGVLYYRTGLSGSDTLINGTAYTTNTLIDVCMTNEGNRIVFTARTGLSYFATWNGTNYTGFQTVNAEATTRSFQSIDMTEDGGIIVATIGTVFGAGTAGVPIWARWNGTNYSAYNNTLNATTDNYIGVAITPDGSRIAYTTYGKFVYYAVWNGTNYSDRILIGSVLHDYGFKLKFSKDGNILFIASYLFSNGTGALQYCIWNGTTFGTLINSGLFSSQSTGIYGMALDYNNNLFIANLNQGIIYKTTFQISNQYSASNFYSAQNLNDNAWRHVAWTIDPTNTTYKYYINGTLIKTDVSLGYAFPGLTTRTNNLLGVATDLSLSYFKGGIDNYKVYNGVLTDAQVYSLFTADAYNSQSLIQYYPFDTNSSSGKVVISSGIYGYANIANLVSGTNVYDASLNGGAKLNNINYSVGNASLELTGTGNHVRMNNSLTTSGIGLSFALWVRGNNGCGQYTLLDYSNGSGGNNKISLGYHNNTLYGQVINGTTINNPTFATGVSYSTGYLWPTEIAGFTYAPTVNRFIYNSFTQGIIYYRNGLTGANVQIASGYAYSAGIAVTYDGSRIVFSVRSGYCYYATWSNSVSNYTGITQINTAYGSKGFNSLDITGDGRVLVVGIGKGFSGQGVAQKPVWATWTGSGYSTYTEVSGTTTSNYVSCAVTNDGSRIAYLENRNSTDALVKRMYYALWNGSNFVQANSGTVVDGNEIYDVKFSRDGNIMFILTYGASPIQYCLWTGSGYGPIIKTTAFPTIASNNGLYVDNTNIYFGSWSGGDTFVGPVYGTTYNVSNQYLNTDFYSAQNLNDNTWRHVAWTIDPSNTTYKYYLNGALIKNDISAGYAFPALTTRTNNLLGVATDLSLSYFNGGIDNYRVYNGVLTHAQILDLYNTEGYSNAITTSTGASLVQYYPFNSNKWSVQPALSANYSLVHQYTFDYHTFNECMVLNTANYTPVYDCRLTNTFTTAPTLDKADYKVGTSSMYFSSNTPFLQVNGVQISASSGVSIACWFKNTSGQLFDFGNAGMDNLSYSPATGITFLNGLTSYTINGGTGKADTTWHHFAWTISSTGIHTVYIDGAVSATTASVAPVSGTRNNNYIGKGTGRVDDFRVYSGVLTLTDIQNLYNRLPTTTTISMVNYYPLDYAQIDNGFVPNVASGYSVYDGVLCNGTALISTVDIYNNRLGTACLYLPGANQYAQIRQVSVNNTGMTIAVWLRVAVSPTGSNLYKITDFGTGTTGSYDNYGIYISNTDIGSHVYIGTTNNTVPFSTTTHIDGNWHYLALTMTYSATNTSTHVLYLDGTSVVTSTTARYPVVGIRANNCIGCGGIGGEFVNGYLDDLRVYNGVMSSTEISALYSLTQYDKVVKIPNLSNHYTFEPTMIGGNYVANMSSNTVKYDMVFGPGVLPTLDATPGNFKQGLRGLRLDGDNKQYVKLNNFSVPSSAGLTIACWFKYTSANGSCLFDFCNTIDTGSDIIAYSPSGGLNFRVGTTVQNSGTGSGKADGTWHHFAWSMVYAASGVNTTHKIYIDGTPTTYTTWQYPTTGTRNYNYIGKSSFTANDYATGYVDDFRIYYGVLIDAEVTGVIGSSTYSTSIQPAIYYTFE